MPDSRDFLPAGAVLGHAFYSAGPDLIVSLPGALIMWDESGLITEVLSPSDAEYKIRRQACESAGRLEVLGPGQYLTPGLVDLHVHAPQWPQSGKNLHLPLYDWLHKKTFPLEARYSDLAFAASVYSSLIDTLLANGTTTAAYFATVDRPGSLLLASLCLERGQRALVGRVAMDLDCPGFYGDASAEAGLEETESFILEVRSLPGNEAPLVLPVVTPRFIPSCSDGLLAGLGGLANKYGCHVQSHCSESDWAHQYVLDRYGRSDAFKLSDFGLLTPKTFLAHCNFLDTADMALLHEAGSAVSHCPLSNFYFSGAVFPLKEALAQGVKVGLGSDISGGPNPFLLDSGREALAASRALASGVDPRLPPAIRGRSCSAVDFREAFWLATAGGGEALGLRVGRFEAGYAFDAVLFDVNARHSNVRIWPGLDSDEDIIQKIFYNASRSNIMQSWVAGRLRHKAESD